MGLEQKMLPIGDDVKKRFVINKDSISYLSWLHYKTGEIYKDANSVDRNGYYIVMLNRKIYRVHRIICSILYPELDITNLYVDHIDGNRKNNNPSNLRLVDKTSNRKNSAIRKNNVSGFVGVSLTNNSGCMYFTACVKLNGKNIKKHFSIKKLGYDLALSEAIKYRLSMIQNLIDSGEDYTERHIYGGYHRT